MIRLEMYLQPINPDEFRKGFMEWVETIRTKISNEIVAIDRKRFAEAKVLQITKNQFILLAIGRLKMA